MLNVHCIIALILVFDFFLCTFMTVVPLLNILDFPMSLFIVVPHLNILDFPMSLFIRVNSCVHLWRHDKESRTKWTCYWSGFNEAINDQLAPAIKRKDNIANSPLRFFHPGHFQWSVFCMNHVLKRHAMEKHDYSLWF